MKNKLLRSRNWMLSFFIVILMTFTAFIGMAGSAQDQETNVDESTGIIAGYVMNIEAKPLAGAIVVLSFGDDNSNTENKVLKQETDEHGFFMFEELPRGLYLLKVHLEGYKELYRELKLPAGETIKLEMKLEKLEQEEEEEVEPVYGKVIGHVFNAVDNEPIAGALVLIYPQENDRELKLETNERGMFEVKLPQGKYVLVVEARGFWPYKEEIIIRGEVDQKLKLPLKPREVEEEEKRPTLCGHIFDAVTDKPIFGWVELSQGSPEIPGPNYDEKIRYDKLNGKTRQAENNEPKEQEEEYKEEFKELVYGKVTGYVFNAMENEPIACAIVVIYHMENDRRLKLETNERGMFETKLPRGKYVLYVEARGFYPYKEELIVRGNDTQKLKVPLKPTEYDEKPEKPEDYKLWRTFTNREGWYEYFEVPAGHYEIRAFAHGHLMFYNEIDIEENSHIYLDIYLLRDPCPPKPEPEPKPVPMSVISGHVFNARTKDPVAGAVVCAVPIKLIKDKFDTLNLDLNNIRLEDLDLENMGLEELGFDIEWNNIEFNQDIDVEYKEMIDEDIDPNLNDLDPGVLPEQPPMESQEPKTRGYDDLQLEPEPLPDGDLAQVDRVLKFCTKTNDDGNFRLKLPAGAYILFVKARGYYLFAHKFYIKPYQHMWVRVPLKPMLDDNDDNNTAPKRPLSEANRPKDLDAPNPGNSNTNTESESETANVGSGVPVTPTGAGPVVSAALGVLFFIIVILGTLLWHKNYNNSSSKSIKKRVIEH